MKSQQLFYFVIQAAIVAASVAKTEQIDLLDVESIEENAKNFWDGKNKRKEEQLSSIRGASSAQNERRGLEEDSSSSAALQHVDNVPEEEMEDDVAGRSLQYYGKGKGGKGGKGGGKGGKGGGKGGYYGGGGKGKGGSYYPGDYYPGKGGGKGKGYYGDDDDDDDDDKYYYGGKGKGSNGKGKGGKGKGGFYPPEGKGGSNGKGKGSYPDGKGRGKGKGYYGDDDDDDDKYYSPFNCGTKESSSNCECCLNECDYKFDSYKDRKECKTDVCRSFYGRDTCDIDDKNDDDYSPFQCGDKKSTSNCACCMDQCDHEFKSKGDRRKCKRDICRAYYGRGTCDIGGKGKGKGRRRRGRNRKNIFKK